MYRIVLRSTHMKVLDHVGHWLSSTHYPLKYKKKQEKLETVATIGHSLVRWHQVPLIPRLRL